MASWQWQARDFLFCGVCGTLLTFDSVRSASCPLCGFKRKAKEIEGKETRYIVTAEDIRRELKIDPFEEVLVQRPVITKSCPECNHSKAEYYSRQTRERRHSTSALSAGTNSRIKIVAVCLPKCITWMCTLMLCAKLLFDGTSVLKIRLLLVYFFIINVHVPY
ncbi:hypothetical protein PVAP13_9KG035066 [Panicum virgatum]|uniref:DNA-directed RNA polymerase subunit n=1 Tax=Panicum virgatum TaxID=38727 RepID=A0A8T0NBN9_PANVG|nr:hypothetical protein PVAP13_9KG035066 [Panicum virgatum]